VLTMTKIQTASRCLPLVSREYANSLASQGFGGFAVNDFVGTDVQAVVGVIGTWRTAAPQETHVSMPNIQPATARTHAPITTSQAEQAAAKRTRIGGLAKAVKEADRGIEGTARRGVPV
jgi:hypothetical protein